MGVDGGVQARKYLSRGSLKPEQVQAGACAGQPHRAVKQERHRGDAGGGGVAALETFEQTVSWAPAQRAMRAMVGEKR